MGVGVGERVTGGGGVTGRGAVVVDAGALDPVAGAVGEGVVGEVAGEADLQEVLVVEQPRALFGEAPVGG